MTGAGKRLVVLISGRGSNLQAIIEANRQGRLRADLAAVISNNSGAAGLRYARDAGIPAEVIDHRAFSTREAFDDALQQAIDRHRPDLVVLAGFMRILGRRFIDHYVGRMINIHPSLLPRFTGLNTHRRAIEAGAREHGATVHFVTHDVDGGPHIIQARVPVLPDDTPESLAQRVLEQEHRIFPLAISWFCQNRLSLHG
ncbi:MAG: phosphoribosylglycinamide formyltransferase [Acidithiobacillales bacterium SM23_46]|nr:MAG: phosphoribosylglycinamide formyltransferase [Acidithiobacillales bacterium SM23_46]